VQLPEKSSRAVLITGASTGIGAACARDLAGRGWRVFAGVRKTQDGEALTAQAGPNITPVLLDVTQPESITGAEKEICAQVGEAGLHGLVNNAGIAIGGPLEFLPMEDIQKQFQVNVFGLIAVTQAFLPLVRMARGRIVLMSSNSGFWCEPFFAPYGATKFGVEAIGDSLRIELRPWNIAVALIEPGMIRTPIWEKTRAAANGWASSLPPECESLYARPLTAVRASIESASGMAIPPERVARAVRHALESRRPKTRYPVGPDSHLQSFLVRWMPDRFRDRLTRWIMKIE